MELAAGTHHVGFVVVVVVVVAVVIFVADVV